MDTLSQNPFSVQTPEGMSAPEIVDLFVDFFSEFFNVEKKGHTFLHGPRGSGKSMMLRFMAPDCQMLHLNIPLQQLPYFGVYASIKATDLNLSEYSRFKDKFAEIIFAEHAMAVFFAAKTIQAIDSAISKGTLEKDESKQIGKFCSHILHRLKQAGWTPAPDYASPTSFAEVMDLLSELYRKTVMYLRMVSFKGEDVPYTGVLLGFHDFLLPLFKDVSNLTFMPNGPIFLMVDDADNLTEKQTEILNTWVSSRITGSICLKIATQLNYKTFRTINGGKIEAPHDFSEINIATIYTSAKEKYPNWVREIVEKRLGKASIDVSPDEFFPEDKDQEAEIEVIALKIKETWPEAGRGYRPGDDAYRYARSEYLKGLRGRSKQGSTYRYAGFKQIVHISSGVIRHFLEAASLMYGEQKKRSKDLVVGFIEPRIQDTVLRKESDTFMMAEFDRLELDESHRPEAVETTKRLKNLITVLGGLFQIILLSDDSERRVFSFALSDDIDSEVKAVLKLGVEHGYLYEAAIGTKEGRGRTRRFVLSRRLAPYFLLDPTGFSAYKFVTNNFLREAMFRPKTVLSRLESKKIEEVVGPSQQDLFSQENS